MVRRSGWRRPQRRGSIGDGALGVAVGSTRHVRTSACRPPCRRGGHPTLSQTQIEWSQAHTPRRLLVEWGQALRDVHESSRVFKVRSRFPATGVGACACSPVRDPLAFCPCGTRRRQAAVASKFYAAHPASKELGTRTGALPSRRRSLTKYRVHTARTRLEAHTWKSGSQHAVDETPRCAPAAPSSTRAVGAVLSMETHYVDETQQSAAGGPTQRLKRTSALPTGLGIAIFSGMTVPASPSSWG